LIDGDIFGVHALAFFDHSLLDLRDWADAKGFELLLHAANCPKQIDGGGTRFADYVADLVEVFLQIAH
jgi:hypothetical protein